MSERKNPQIRRLISTITSEEKVLLVRYIFNGSTAWKEFIRSARSNYQQTDEQIIAAWWPDFEACLTGSIKDTLDTGKMTYVQYMRGRMWLKKNNISCSKPSETIK